MIPKDPFGKNGPQWSVIRSKPLIEPPKQDIIIENFEKLKIIFPNMEQKIRELVFEKHQNEKNICFFIDHILNLKEYKEDHSTKLPIKHNNKTDALKGQAVANLTTEESGSEDNEDVNRTYTKGEIDNTEVVLSVRNDEKTQSIRKNLLMLFSQNLPEIEETLKRYRYETNLHFFIDKLIQYID